MYFLKSVISKVYVGIAVASIHVLPATLILVLLMQQSGGFFLQKFDGSSLIVTCE